MKTLEKKDVLRVFPELRESNKTVLVLKKPKTETSTRKIFLPRTVAELTKVVFHSLRHSSITYKLKLNGGDIKAVQGDSGHAQAQMVTDQYSHILDDDRMHNADLFEQAFYGGKGC